MSPQDILEKLGKLFEEGKMPTALMHYLELECNNLRNIALDFNEHIVFIYIDDEGNYGVDYRYDIEISKFLK